MTIPGSFASPTQWDRRDRAADAERIPVYEPRMVEAFVHDPSVWERSR
jgi:hypothetical protein